MDLIITTITGVGALNSAPSKKDPNRTVHWQDITFTGAENQVLSATLFNRQLEDIAPMVGRRIKVAYHPISEPWGEKFITKIKIDSISIAPEPQDPKATTNAAASPAQAPSDMPRQDAAVQAELFNSKTDGNSSNKQPVAQPEPDDLPF